MMIHARGTGADKPGSDVTIAPDHGPRCCYAITLLLRKWRNVVTIRSCTPGFFVSLPEGNVTLRFSFLGFLFRKGTYKMAPRGKAKKGNVDGATATATEEGVISITMTKDKECKNSIRYVALEPDVPITNVYVMRSLGEMPESFSLQMILD